MTRDTTAETAELREKRLRIAAGGFGPAGRLLTSVVGNLTNPGCAAVALLAYASTAAGGTATAWQPVEEIKSAAEEFVRLTVGKDDSRIAPSAGHLDARLQLPRCDAPLAPYLQNPGRRTGRIVVGVRCPGEKPWNIYLPVTVAVMEDVVVTATSLARDHALRETDLAIERRDVSGLAAGYLTDPGQLVGQTTKRAVGRGIVLTPQQVAPAVLIEKGQTVTLTVETRALAIRMSGKALSSGAENERIRVENTASGRVVEGIVRSDSVVQVEAW